MLFLSLILLFSCTERREARRRALEEIKAMPNEELAVHPLVDQIHDFERQLEDIQALLDGEDPEKTIPRANASLRELRKKLSDMESGLDTTDGELDRLKRLFEKQLSELERQP
jgi:chromosome segregation ATPase